MIQLNAVFFILLIEAAVLLLALSVFLAWRLLRRRPVALSTPEDLMAQARRFLESELMRTEALLDEASTLEEGRAPRLERRRDAIEAELAALDLTDSDAAYWERVESGYEVPSTEAHPEAEVEPADTEAQAAPEDNEPQDADAALEALKADYQALLETLNRAELDDDTRLEVDAATDRWHERLKVIERQLHNTPVGVGGERRNTDVTVLESGDRDRLRQIIDQQDELIWDLKKDMASAISDAEKLKYLEERIDNIMRQARELQACVNVLEDENNFLFQQLRERDGETQGPAAAGEAAGLDRAHVGFLLASQQEALEALDAAVEGLQASDLAAEDVMRARGALTELLTCAESLQSAVQGAPARNDSDTAAGNTDS
ncbi:hypothetical protein H0Z60_08760 [Ectothiorhodospiraceae bacterium WFHF3C12]|nr:hypothetical protein [Ectothiorhodospiraceae bacterium WFHF3C12]